MSLDMGGGQASLPFPEMPEEDRECLAPRVGKLRAKPHKSSIESGTLQALSNQHNVVFLDVETTGLSRYYDEITLVGWLHKGLYQVYLPADNPAALMQSLATASAIVTFNGTLFDIPFLKKTFGEIALPPIHVDLRFLGRRAGLTGGQKIIEKTLGICIRDGIEEVDGAEAVLLWHKYLRGDLEALRRLIAYNRCDVLAMRSILDEVIDRLVLISDLLYFPSRFSTSRVVAYGLADLSSSLPKPDRLNRRAHSFSDLFKGSAAEDATIVGIDLTGSEVRPSGWCLLKGARAETSMISTDDEMIERIVAASPSVVSIDSPLSLPFGRRHVGDDDPGRREFGIMRRSERELKRRGINVYPCLLPSMQGLTNRGIRLAGRLRSLGIAVIESYPGAAQDIMGIPRKGAGEAFLKQGLVEFGVSGEFAEKPVRHDELDAITAALVGSFFLANRYEALSGPTEDPLIIPDLNAEKGPIILGISGRIAAGKTTAATALSSIGFAYTRFSQIVDDEIQARGMIPDRSLRQQAGIELHETKGQRWIAERVHQRVAGNPLIVVDGLRFLEDRAYFAERAGARFLHIHVIAPYEMRAKRYRLQNPSGDELSTVDDATVESEIERLGGIADIVLNNASSIDALAAAVEKVANSFIERSNNPCRSQSS